MAFTEEDLVKRVRESLARSQQRLINPQPEAGDGGLPMLDNGILREALRRRRTRGQPTTGNNIRDLPLI